MVVYHSLSTISRELALSSSSKGLQFQLVLCQSCCIIIILLLMSEACNSLFIQFILGQLLILCLCHRFMPSRNRFPLLSHQGSVALFYLFFTFFQFIRLLMLNSTNCFHSSCVYDRDSQADMS